MVLVIGENVRLCQYINNFLGLKLSLKKPAKGIWILTCLKAFDRTHKILENSI